MKYIRCTRQGCAGYMVSIDGMALGRKRRYRCVKCGHIEAFDGGYIDAKID